MSRIAIVDLSFTWPPDGGARTDIREVATRLQKDHEVRFFVPSLAGWLKLGPKWVRWPLDRTRFFWKGKISRDAGINYTLVPFGPLSFGAKEIGKRIKAHVDEWKPDHVFIADGWYLKPYVILALQDYRPVVRIYAHEMLCLKGNGFFYKWGKACDRNYLNQNPLTHLRCTICTKAFYASYPSPTWIHEFFTSRAFLPGYVKTVIKGLEAAEKVIVYNEFTANRIRPFAKDVQIVPSGVNLAHFSPRQRESKTDGKKIILAMGRSEEPRKGVSTLIHAAKMLRQKRDDFEIWLTDNRSSDEAWIKHIGWQKFEEMPELYRSVDVAVVPSLWPEPHGIVAVEAMACEVPVVLSRIGGLQEVCEDEKSGLLFAPGNSGELRDKLERLLDDADLRVRLGKSGAERARTLFDWDHIVKSKIQSIFQREKEEKASTHENVAQ